jgi:pimeloyl-ACP methyl ester carboxylesterase
VISVPTTVIWGTEDPVLPLTLDDPGRDRVPDCRVVPVEGAGHFVQSDAPERVSQLILDAVR